MLLNFFILFTILLTDVSSNGDDAAIFNGDEWKKVSSNLFPPKLKPPAPITYLHQVSHAQIFVAIAAFRDSRCSVTLYNLFSKAKHPERIHIGLVEQIHTEEDSSNCADAFCQLFKQRENSQSCPYKSQINTLLLSFQDARGPAFARSMQQQLYRQEEFCMQVDSHVDVVQDWDDEMVEMWLSTENEYAVLSTEPPDLSLLNEDSKEVPHVCHAAVTPNGMIRNMLPRAAMNLQRPLLAPLWSAAYSFSKCHAEVKTPYDPHYLYIFDGEEFSKFARLWTRGYDVYTPHKTLIGHDNKNTLSKQASAIIGANADPTEWVQNGMKDTYRYEMYAASVKRIQTLLGMPEGDKLATQLATLTQYGLGMKRTLDQFIEFTGVDTRSLTVFEDKCKHLAWVPFAADSMPAYDSTDVWGYSSEVLKKNGPNIPLLPGKIEFEYYADMSSPTSAGASIHGSYAATAKGELWWVFQSIDRAVEAAIFQVDSEVGSGHGHRVLKLILLFAPLFVVILYTAVQVMTGGGAVVKPVLRGDTKRI